jgi:hypothetical protein
MMEERGVEVDHTTLDRRVVDYAPLVEKQFCARKRSIGFGRRPRRTSTRSSVLHRATGAERKREPSYRFLHLDRKRRDIISGPISYHRARSDAHAGVHDGSGAAARLGPKAHFTRASAGIL